MFARHICLRGLGGQVSPQAAPGPVRAQVSQRVNLTGGFRTSRKPQSSKRLSLDGGARQQE